MAVLASINNETQEQIIERLIRENAALRAQGKGKLSLKVSEKGAISIYGMGRWPVTMYRQQMERLLDNAEQVRAFIAANEASLSVKE